MSLHEDSEIGDELRQWERNLLWRGICPMCHRESLIDGPKLGAMLIMCMTLGCDFECRVQRSYSLKGELAPDSFWMTVRPRVFANKGAA